MGAPTVDDVAAMGAALMSGDDPWAGGTPDTPTGTDRAAEATALSAANTDAFDAGYQDALDGNPRSGPDVGYLG